MELEKQELQEIVGGVNATYINAIVRGVNTILDIGRSLGSVIRRLTSGNLCPL